MENLNNNALVLTNGLLTSSDAKTAHGLIRGTERFNIIGIVDCAATTGKDAGELLDGKHRNIPVFENFEAQNPRNFLVQFQNQPCTISKLTLYNFKIKRYFVADGCNQQTHLQGNTGIPKQIPDTRCNRAKAIGQDHLAQDTFPRLPICQFGKSRCPRLRTQGSQWIFS